MSAGRYAPSPTSALHLGNLRTAVVAWLLARATGRDFLLRVEDLDQQRVTAAPDLARAQIEDLRALGLTFDGDVVWQSERLAVYEDAISRLDTYECYCTRREIAEASQAPNSPDGYRPYPGTCAHLTDAERAERRLLRPPALRVRAGGATMTVRDRWAGEVTGEVDDFVVRRNDGTHAYNLAVVVDDVAAGVDQVCRGDDLLTSAPRQAWLARQLGGVVPEYAHVGLVRNADGKRLAKRDGDPTLAQAGGPAAVLAWIGQSLGLSAKGEAVGLALLRQRFDPDGPRPPEVVTAASAR